MVFRLVRIKLTPQRAWHRVVGHARGVHRDDPLPLGDGRRAREGLRARVRFCAIVKPCCTSTGLISQVRRMHIGERR